MIEKPFNESGALQVPQQMIIEKLTLQVSELTVKLATLQGANSMLQQYIKNLENEIEVSRIIVENATKQKTQIPLNRESV